MLEQTTSGERYLSIVSGKPEQRQIVRCEEAQQAEDFFQGFRGSRITDVLTLRYEDHDAVVLVTNDERAVVVVAQPGSFIEIHKSGGPPKSQGHLAFREDLSVRRVNMPLSVAADRMITYKEQQPVMSEVVQIDPATEFSQATLQAGGLEIGSIRPSWWGETRLNVRTPDGEVLTIRADRKGVWGVVTFDKAGLNYLVFDDIIMDIYLPQLPKGSISGKLQLPTEST